MNQIKHCAECGNICELMDTVCPRCRRYGTLQERFECSRCGKVLEEPHCEVCAAATGIREGALPVTAPHKKAVAESEALREVVDPHAVPPWLAGGVGGIVVGGVAGGIGAYFFNINPWI